MMHSSPSTSLVIRPECNTMILPGNFVVLQGMRGDGMVNTIDTSPVFERNGSSFSETTNERQAIIKWQKDCIARAQSQASDWQKQQRACPTADTLPLFERLQDQSRWWVEKGQLVVFRQLPRGHASPNEPRYPFKLLPGYVVNGTALHSYDMVFGKWSCPRTVRRHSNAEPEDDMTFPQAGRVQYLEIDTPVHGFVLYSFDGYQLVGSSDVEEATPTALTAPTDNDNDKNDDDNNNTHKDDGDKKISPIIPWWWRVVSPSGVVLYKSPYPQTQQQQNPVAKLPYGTCLQVLQKIDVTKTKRAKEQQQATSAATIGRILQQERNIRASAFQLRVKVQIRGFSVQGWCTEQERVSPNATGLPPGLHFPTVQPIPMVYPTVWKVVLPNDQGGAVIRQNACLSSPQISQLSCGVSVVALGRVWVEGPGSGSRYVSRLVLAPGAAYASTHLLSHKTNQKESLVLQPTGAVDSEFDPQDPGRYHWNLHRAIPRPSETSSKTNTRNSSCEKGLPPSKLFNASGTLPTRASHDNDNDNDNKWNAGECMICLDRIINAGLVHGATAHACACWTCSLKVKALGCPVCRQPIDRVVELFFPARE